MVTNRSIALFWGRVQDIEGGQIRVRTRYSVTELIDVFTPTSSSKQVSFTVKKNDLVMVLSINGFNIAFVGGVAKTLEQPEEGFETITYGKQVDFTEGKLSDQENPDTIPDNEAPEGGDEVQQSIKVMNKKVVVEGFDEVVLKTKSIKVESENVRIGAENSMKTGVVTQACQCAFTGAFHPEASKIIKASK